MHCLPVMFCVFLFMLLPSWRNKVYILYSCQRSRIWWNFPEFFYAFLPFWLGMVKLFFPSDALCIYTYLHSSAAYNHRRPWEPWVMSQIVCKQYSTVVGDTPPHTWSLSMPVTTRGSGRASWAPPAGFGWSPSQKWIWCIFWLLEAVCAKQYACVRSSMLHGSETWPVRKENEVALQRAEMRMVR